MAAWYDNVLVLRDFADALVRTEAIESVTPVLSKPYRFTSEYNLWKQAGFPGSEEDEGWTAFIDGLDEENEDEDEEETE